MNNTEEILVEDEDFDSGDWYADLVEAHATKLPDNAVTVEMFMEDTGLSEATAREILKEKVEKEEAFQGKKMVVDGYKRWVFWKE